MGFLQLPVHLLGGDGMGIKEALDIALSAGVDVMMFFRGMWDLFPLAVRALIFIGFGLAVLFGVLKMIF